MGLSDHVFRVHVALFFDEECEFQVMKLALELQERLNTLFPNEPQILPLPPEAPKEALRCIFQKMDADANLTFSLLRLDYNAGLREGVDWMNHVGVVVYALINSCKKVNIKIRRFGVVAQSRCEQDLIQEVDKKISIDGYTSSEEKSVSWLVRKKLDESIDVNVITNIQHNINNPDIKNIVSVDVNTHIDSYLNQDERNLADIIVGMCAIVEGKLNHVL